MWLPDEKLEKIKKLWLEKYFIITQPSTDLKKLNLFYQSIDLLVHTSFIGESFWNIYAEAMANGKAIITNSTPYKDNAQVEIVQNNINWLIWVYPEDFADKVYNLLTNKNKLNLFEKNNLEYAKTFDAKIRIKYYQKLYTDLVNWKTEEYFFKVADLQDFEQVYDNTINALHSKKNWLYEWKIFWYRLQTKLKTMLWK